MNQSISDKTDAVLWYDVGEFGELGYGYPNPSNDLATLNPVIANIVRVIGLNLFAIMHHEDTMTSTPPSINTITRINQLYVRLAQILQARSLAPNEARLESSHVRPAPQVFIIHPCPYHEVRSPFLHRFASLTMVAMSEAMQHTENSNSMVISETFAKDIGKFFRQIYYEIATELFGKTKQEAQADGFILTPADLQSYNPPAWFTETEMVDTVPSFKRVLTEDRLRELRAGIPANALPEFKTWPVDVPSLYNDYTNRSGTSDNSSAAGSSAPADVSMPG